MPKNSISLGPVQLVEEYQPKPDLNWLEQFEVKISEDLTGEDGDYEYQQPELSIFPDGDDWPLS